MAGLGALFGGLTGVVTGTFAGPGVTARIDALLTWVFPLPVRAQQLLPTAAAQIGGIVGGILGAINGAFELAWRAFVWPWQELYRGDPTWPAAVAVGQVVAALFVGGLFVAWTAATEGLRLRVSGARPMSRREADWLMPIVDECAGRLGLRSLPRILVDDRREANAHTGIRHIVINYGLLEQLEYDREAIGGVLAHELAHWRDGDAIGMAWTKGVALPLYLLYEFAERLLGLARSRPMHFVVRFLFWSVIVTTRYFVIPIQAGLWRRGEYRADAAAAAAGYGEGLRAALTHLRHSFDGERSGWDRAICATHPPNELRLERLEQPGKSYPLHDDHPLLKAMPRHIPGSTVEKGW
jgi:Zn-dependent protease with chaperone function